MSAIDDMVAANEGYAAGYVAPSSGVPRRAVAIVACMDARVDPYAALGLRPGDAHVVRNAGGVVTDDTIRSLTISQRLLGTRAVMLIHHTECGMQTIDEEEFRAAIAQETGLAPGWEVEAFRDLAADVKESIRRVKESPFLGRTEEVRGFVLDVGTGRLTEVG